MDLVHAFPGSLQGVPVFFSCEMAENMAKSVESCYKPGFQLTKETCLQAKACLCISAIQPFFSLYFSYVYELLSPVNGLLTWAQIDK